MGLSSGAARTVPWQAACSTTPAPRLLVGEPGRDLGDGARPVGRRPVGAAQIGRARVVGPVDGDRPRAGRRAASKRGSWVSGSPTTSPLDVEGPARRTRGRSTGGRTPRRRRRRVPRVLSTTVDRVRGGVPRDAGEHAHGHEHQAGLAGRAAVRGGGRGGRAAGRRRRSTPRPPHRPRRWRGQSWVAAGLSRRVSPGSGDVAGVLGEGCREVAINHGGAAGIQVGSAAPAGFAPRRDDDCEAAAVSSAGTR